MEETTRQAVVLYSSCFARASPGGIGTAAAKAAGQLDYTSIRHKYSIGNHKYLVYRDNIIIISILQGKLRHVHQL